ncbi:MAG: PIN domain-containing protein [Nitrospirae bacterium]|uniref:PIN domain-containing protein n=1 Tax=Candidatus Magnetobacterium casense TaxID=1455061 RepID=UPI00058F17CF|nr:PIN domain-containing protein [Candidatus Magnetobacterium casensis]MBF0339047.1 PIN domain-containing protein [Nitrospirota bacterium]
MSDKVFVDTNIIVYYISNHQEKKQKAMDIFLSSTEIYISSQVVGELINVCFSKNLLHVDDIVDLTDEILEAFNFFQITEVTIKQALQIKKLYKYAYWDSLIIASAFELDCCTLYTEDMQDNQIINGSLKIVNPFKTALHL